MLEIKRIRGVCGELPPVRDEIEADRASLFYKLG